MKIVKATGTLDTHWTIRKILEMLHDGDINDNIDIQRGYVWKNNEKKSAFIRSLIIDRAVPPLYFNKIDDTYDLVDGKQRIRTVDKFMNDEFKLSGLDYIEVINDDGEVEEVDINGMIFSELPECMQNAIKEYNFTISFTDNASQEEVADIFYNLNNGQTINAATMNRVKSASRGQLVRLGKHRLFKESLSEFALENHVNEDLVAKAHALLYAEDVSTDAKWIRPYMRTMHITQDEEDKLNVIFDRICVMHSLIEDNRVARRIYSRTHMISIIPIVGRSIDEGKTDEQITKWFSEFFNGRKSATISKTYNSYASSGSGKKEAIKKRLKEIENSYIDFFMRQEQSNIDEEEQIQSIA